MNGLLTLLIIPLAIWLTFVTVVYFYQPNLLYFPDIPGRELESTPARIGLDYEAVKLTTADHLALDAWYIHHPSGRGTLLFFHGNAGNMAHRLESIRQFHAMGFAILIFDYRGYGQSEGKPTEEGTYTDAEAAWSFLTDTRNIPPDKIVLFGRSLGGAIAAQLAARHRPGAIIIESTFTSVPDIARDLYPWLPVKRLSRFQYNAKSSISAISSPVLIVHSRDDEIIPFAHGQALYAHASEPKHLLEIRGGHNDGFLVSGDLYTTGIDEYLSTWFPRPGSD